MRRCRPCALASLRTKNALHVGAAGQRGAGDAGRRPSSGRRPPSPPTRAPARRPARPARRSRPGAGSRAWRRRSTARCAPLVSVTSPITSACVRSSSTRRCVSRPSSRPYVYPGVHRTDLSALCIAIVCSGCSSIFGLGLVRDRRDRGASQQTSAEIAGQTQAHRQRPGPRQAARPRAGARASRASVDDVNDVLLAVRRR